MQQNKLAETDLNLSIAGEDEYQRLMYFFAENHLEVDAEEAVPTDVIRTWKITPIGSDKLVGAIALGYRQEEYIIDGIAVEETYRKTNIGKTLLDEAISLVKERGGKRIYLVARAPGFFRKSGFATIPREEAPMFFECLTCPQYGVDCHPEVMLMEV
jgi:N-acetylglutamate synthase-like GNAT family acetyltransferase